MLQERTVEPVGSERTRAVDVRVIAATNVDLQTRISQGQFREDLFYRLNVIPVRVPGLAERNERGNRYHFRTRRESVPDRLACSGLR